MTGGDEFNSNSVANTIWNFLQDTLSWPSGLLKDFDSYYSLLPGVDEDILANVTWSPNINSSGNVIGSNVVDNFGTNDLVTGAGNDVIIGETGNDNIDGGAGNDTAVYYGDYHDYKITATGSNIFVQDLNSSDGDEGTDTLSR